jgi:hypothetical protein
MGSSKGRFEAKTGAKAYWPDGRLAGEVVDAARFPEEIEPQNGRRCLKKALRYVKPGETGRPENYLTLCFDPADISG